MPPIIWIPFLVLNLFGFARDRTVARQERTTMQHATSLSRYPVLTCRDVYGHTFPDDSIRQRDLMIAIGCGNGKDTLAVARVLRDGETESAIVDSVLSRIARDTTRRPP